MFKSYYSTLKVDGNIMKKLEYIELAANLLKENTRLSDEEFNEIVKTNMKLERNYEYKNNTKIFEHKIEIIGENSNKQYHINIRLGVEMGKIKSFYSSKVS